MSQPGSEVHVDAFVEKRQHLVGLRCLLEQFCGKNQIHGSSRHDYAGVVSDTVQSSANHIRRTLLEDLTAT
jgi:hypothetical protein